MPVEDHGSPVREPASSSPASSSASSINGNGNGNLLQHRRLSGSAIPDGSRKKLIASNVTETAPRQPRGEPINLARSATDISLLRTSSGRTTDDDEEGGDDNGHGNRSVNPGSTRHQNNPLYNTEVRHGFAAEQENEQLLNSLTEYFYLYYESKRHETGGNPKFKHGKGSFPEWRIRDRQRTVCAAIVLCLNIGVDPPDIIKTQPCAKLEAWVDPSSFGDSKKTLDQIGKNLVAQYEVLSMRTKYRQQLDPIMDDMKRFCMGLRRSAREERVLFHYNGHGVPKPTPNGEIWVFNRGYTQYIPINLHDLQSWLGSPCIYVFDCNSAGVIVSNFKKAVERRKREESERQAALANGTPQQQVGPPPQFTPEQYENCIQLAACRVNETLPMHPDLPADLFTCCLTSPIDIAVRWFVMQSPLSYDVTDLVIPGRITDRKTPLGELNWIFTAITDTIAWTTLEGGLFKRLFRQDLVVAALFRNFLLAERIMRVHNCHPVSNPVLPDTHNHPMWDAWDLAIDHCLVQLKDLQEASRLEQPLPYTHSKFFEQQLTAFEVWLRYNSTDLNQPPEQLPVLLQVLLSQSHRLRALILLSKFLDLGPKAVHLALSIGIFPYVLKLLQSPAPELKPVLIFIWARIMAVDYPSVQTELMKENGYAYFMNIYVMHHAQQGVVIQSASVFEHMTMCAFILTLFVRGHPAGQKICANPELYAACVSHMSEPDCPLLSQWSCLLLSQIWQDAPAAKQLAVEEDVLERLVDMLGETEADVRTACILAITTFLEQEEGKQETTLALAVLGLANDASPLVRREVVCFFSKFVKMHMNRFLVAAYTSMEEEVAAMRDAETLENVRLGSPAYGTLYFTIWKALLVLAEDPHQQVTDFAQDVVDYVLLSLQKTPLGSDAQHLQKVLYQTSVRSTSSTSSGSTAATSTSPDKRSAAAAMATRAVSSSGSMAARTPSSSSHQDFPSTPESRFSSTLRRSVSFATSLKNYAFGTPESGHDAANSPPSSPNNNNNNNHTNSAAAAAANAPAFDTPSVTTVPYGSGLKPPVVRYSNRTLDRDIKLPLESGFFDSCCEHFEEPQMAPPELDEPGSERYLERLWRKSRNEEIIAETQGQKDLAVCGNWNTQIGYLDNVTQPVKLVHAQFEPHLIACDDRDGVTVWDWTESAKLNRFCNSNPQGTRITEAKLLNEDDQPLLLTGSSDGVVKLYRHYQDPQKIEVASAWRVLTDLAPGVSKSNALIAEWQQSRGALLVAGDSRVIRVWNAPKEKCIADIPARSGAAITSLTSDQVQGNVLVAGFGDGAIRVYDRRMDPRDSLVKTWKRPNSSWIVNVHMQRGGTRELVSGSVDGMVRLWDIRSNDKPVEEFRGTAGTGRVKMRAMDVHEHAPVVATATNTINVWSTKGVKVSSIKTNTSGGAASYMLPGANKTYQVSALAFHPHQMGLAIANGHDSHISVLQATTR